MRRGKEINDTSDLQNAQETLEHINDLMDDTFAVLVDNAMDGVRTENADALNSEHKQMAQRIVTPSLDLGSAMRQELVLKEKQDAELQELDEADEFQAGEAQRLKRVAGQQGGRPKKSRIKVVAY